MLQQSMESTPHQQDLKLLWRQAEVQVLLCPLEWHLARLLVSWGILEQKVSVSCPEALRNQRESGRYLMASEAFDVLPKRAQQLP